MERNLTDVLVELFNHWSAFRIAVLNASGCPQKLLALQSIDELVSCLNNRNMKVEDVEDMLEDIMDSKFNTICEDGSVKEIAVLTHKLANLVKDRNWSEIDAEFAKLPHQEKWLDGNPNVVFPEHHNSDDSMSDNEVYIPKKRESAMKKDVEMDEDGWTKVRGKKH